MTRPDVVAEIDREADVLAAVFGEETHPNGTGPDLLLLDVLPRYSNLRDIARTRNDVRSAGGLITRADALLEDTFAALAEEDPARLRAGLVKLAGGAARWIEAIDRAEV